MFGKAGRAETATDPAGLEMFETTIQFKPQSQWPSGMTQDQLIDEMNRALKIPGFSNLWVQPIRNRIDMLSTGIKSPVGIKIAGPDLKVIERIGSEVEATVKGSARDPLRLCRACPAAAMSRCVSIASRGALRTQPRRCSAVVALAIGGENVGETVEGLQRFPINVRYPRELRDSVEKLRVLPIVTAAGATTTLGRSQIS